VLGMSATSLSGPRGCLFTFHRVAPSALWKTLPNRNFYIDLEFFDRLLIYLRRAGWKIVTIEEALERAGRADPKDRYVNFSIDDGYRDTYELVIPLFRRHRVPITLYVTTGIPDGKVPMWWAGLEETLLLRDRVIFENRTLEVQTGAAKRRAYSQIERAWTTGTNRYEAFCAQNDIDAEAAHWRHAISWQMLAELRNDPLVEIGSHGSMHLRFSTLESSDALAELKGGRERLMQKIGVRARHFAFPYGRSGDCGPRDFEFAREAGFCSAATTRKGVIRGQQDSFRLPRNTLNGAHRSLAMMELHLNGITGAAARMLDRV
jgi:peptidoglycan/xylan/chitin deacetylase (PgdA/CDA1 family)